MSSSICFFEIHSGNLSYIPQACKNHLPQHLLHLLIQHNHGTFEIVIDSLVRLPMYTMHEKSSKTRHFVQFIVLILMLITNYAITQK